MSKPIRATPKVFGVDADRIRSAMAKSSVLTPAQKLERREGIKSALKRFSVGDLAPLALALEGTSAKPVARRARGG